MKQSDIDRQLEFRHIPEESAIGSQRWSDLAFLHWRVNPRSIQELLPETLVVDTFDGQAWVGLVPFQMSQVKVRKLPVVPWICRFPETNVRTYVKDQQGRPGVWFFSLDASRLLPVLVARIGWGLNYIWSRMSITKNQNAINYCGRRILKPSIHYSVSIELNEQSAQASDSLLMPAKHGTLEFFLVERYLMYVQTGKSIYSGRVWHHPYEICKPELGDCTQNLTEIAGVSCDEVPHHVAYCPGVETKIFPLHKQA